MKLLALDTSTEACSAALWVEDMVVERLVIAPRGHAEQILEMVDELLHEVDLPLSSIDALAFGRGPGAFTGVRIGASVAQGIALSADLPVLPISSLAALAQGILSESEHDRVVAAIDARMGEVYWGAFERRDEMAHLVGAEAVSVPEQVQVLDGDDWFGVGTGWDTYSGVLQQQLGSRLVGFEGQRYPLARDLMPLARWAFESGESVDAAHALPVYLRDQVVQKPAG